MAPGPGAQFVEKTISKLKFPQAFAFFVALFLLDLIVPDFVPFIDEILLAAGTVMLSRWKKSPEPPPVQLPPR